MKEEELAQWSYFATPLFHRQLFEDTLRIKAYQKAIKAVIKPGDTVIDLGCGLGILSFLARDHGAAAVYAIEKTDIINEAKIAAQKNSISNITFLQKLSTQVTDVQDAQVLITETLGEMGIDEGILAYVQDAKRMLAKKHRLIPHTIRVFVVPFESQQLFKKYVGFWQESYFGIDYTNMQRHFKQVSADVDEPFRFISEPQQIFSFDLAHDHDRPVHTADFKFTFHDRAECCGLMGYFEADLAKDITLTNNPIRKPTSWKNILFFETHPKLVDVGDTLSGSIEATTGPPLQWHIDWNHH